MHELFWIGSAWYFSAPGLVWDAALKITKVQLQLLSDAYMFLMIKCIRGGIATISHCHTIDNNEYMGNEFYPAKESKFISYLNANNIHL